MHDKNFCPSIESWLSVFVDFCRKLLNLQRVRELYERLSIYRNSFFPTSTKNNLIYGFIF